MSPVTEAPLQLTPEPKEIAPPLSEEPVSIPLSGALSSPSTPQPELAPPSISESPAFSSPEVTPTPTVTTPIDEIAAPSEEAVPIVEPPGVASEPVSAATEKPAKSPRPYRAKRKIHPVISFSVAVLLIVGVLVGLIVMNRKEQGLEPLEVQTPKVKEEAVARQNFLNDGWMNYSSNTLVSFLKAQSPADKAPHILGGKEKIDHMTAFYGTGHAIDESDTPVDVFDHVPLDIDDRRRGIFLMQYDQPAQVDMRQFFVPVATLEVKHKLEEPDILLSAFADREQYMMEPVRVMAFFKEVENRLLLDWDVYSQTKYRTLKHFTKSARPGQKMTFRVMAREVLPPARSSVDPSKTRFFRFSDPAHAGDKIDIPITNESLPGQILADIAWINIPGEEADNRYATVELAWTESDQPSLQLSRVICWEFLGLGGVEGNADPVGSPSKKKVPVDLDFLEPDPLGPDTDVPAEEDLPSSPTGALPPGPGIGEEESPGPTPGELELPETEPVAPGPIEEAP